MNISLILKEIKKYKLRTSALYEWLHTVFP